MPSKNKVTTKVTNQEQFLKDLLQVCRKHRVNMFNSKVEMYYGSDHEYVQIDVHEVTGAWDIKSEYDAVIAEEISKPAEVQSWTIKGCK